MVLLYKPLYGWQISSLNAILINTFASELVFAHLRMSVHFDVWHIFTCLIRFKGCVLCIHFTKLILTAWVFFFNPSNYLYPNFFFCRVCCTAKVCRQTFDLWPLNVNREKKRHCCQCRVHILRFFLFFFIFVNYKSYFSIQRC